MREKAISFGGPMVRALRAGTKTQTRRVAKGVVALHSRTGEALAKLDSAGPRVACPYGQPGDLLWVKEAWRACVEADSIPPRDMDAAYRIWYEADVSRQPGAGRYRHARFMPRWACRITLEITGVRAERLQDISADDAYDEGTAEWAAETTRNGNKWSNIVRAYQGLWESINGPGSWDANPWVWVLEFKPVKP